MLPLSPHTLGIESLPIFPVEEKDDSKPVSRYFQSVNKWEKTRRVLDFMIVPDTGEELGQDRQADGGKGPCSEIVQGADL